MDQQQFEDNKDMRRLVKHKLLFGLGQLVIMIIGVIFCAYHGYIDKSATATILSGICAFSLRGVFDK